jgi:protein disulfide-isomerase A1
MLPAVSKLDAKSYKNFQTTDKLVVIGYIGSKDKESQEIFEELANQLRDDYTFGLVTDKKAITAEGYEDAPKVVIYKENEPSLVYESEIDSAEIANFIRLNALPTFGEIDGNNFASYAELGLPLAYTFYGDKEQLKEIDAALRPLAEKYHGKLSFVKIDGSQYGGHADALSIPTEFPSFGVQRLDDAAKFPLLGKKATDVDAVDELVAAVVAGTAQPHLKSAPVPESNDEPVKIVVGEQFDDIVLNKDQHVFLEVYAPWCGHCKNLAPIWEELGQHYADDKNVVIAKLDGTENDLPASAGLKIEGFPTLVVYKKGTNELISYSGKRTFEGLKEFVDALDAIDTSSEEAAPEAAPKAAEDAHDEL